MTDPTENEEINEELSTDELKTVIGGSWSMDQEGSAHYTQSTTPTVAVRGQGTAEALRGNGPEGSGFGGTRRDWEKRNSLTQPAMEMPTYN